MQAVAGADGAGDAVRLQAVALLGAQAVVFVGVERLADGGVDDADAALFQPPQHFADGQLDAGAPGIPGTADVGLEGQLQPLDGRQQFAQQVFVAVAQGGAAFFGVAAAQVLQFRLLILQVAHGGGQLVLQAGDLQFGRGLNGVHCGVIQFRNFRV